MPTGHGPGGSAGCWLTAGAQNTTIRSHSRTRIATFVSSKYPVINALVLTGDGHAPS
jgi:hypothetical protein